MRRPSEFERLVRDYRGGIIIEQEFTLAFLMHAIYEPESLGNTSPNLSERELVQIILRARSFTSKKSFRKVSALFIPNGGFDEEDVWDKKERELRPKFNHVVSWLEAQLKNVSEYHQ